MQKVLADTVVSVAELKDDPVAVMATAGDLPVAVLNHDHVMAYLVPAKLYEVLIQQLDDFALIRVAESRASEQGVPVSLDDL